ncbi:MAG TPA: thioredoxin domain-containing protein [Candidatus Deferrimicrobium sp.]|nr:thioredoxin domain-containing protein [Candidatus Deferrimicrobium sp.]
MTFSEFNSKKTNKLIHEKSPYLLQHAYNPVNWYPWGSEAFEKAGKEDKPIFLSIGYSTCHWCHVMEQESFEDAEVAKLMNEVFVSIKVDREERPDIDNLYITVCQAMTGRGGWPLTIIMTPDKKPFFAATYIPKHGRFGSTGLLKIIPAINDYWKNKREDVRDSANKVLQAIQATSTPSKGEELGTVTLAMAYTQLLKKFDKKDGGFSDAPKFPTPHIILFLLRYWKRTGSDQALYMVEKTLQSMRLGGIFDQLGFGFHRYSTDYFWLLPHFEKMLYDQALLAIAYTEAYQATKKREYESTAREIFTYVLRDMTDPMGGFYSAEDADSKDEKGTMIEGKFYVWTEEELKKIMDSAEVDLITKVFNIKNGGNFLDQATQKRTGENILHLKKPPLDLASDLKISEVELKKFIENIRLKLFNHREKRFHPRKDDKILTDWNGLMIAALSIAARVFDNQNYLKAAQKAVDFIFNRMLRSDGRLLHRYRDGEAAVLANVDDYAFLIWALLELYETTFETRYLQKSIELQTELMDHFWDKIEGGFYFTADDAEVLLVRKKEVYDGAIPSGNSVAMLNLLRLGKVTGNSDYEKKAARIGQVFANEVNRIPAGFTMLLVSLEFAMGPSYQIVIAGNSQAEDTKLMIQKIREQFLPNKVMILNPTDQPSPEIIRIANFIENQKTINNKDTAYICINNSCKNPVTNVNNMLKALEVN